MMTAAKPISSEEYKAFYAELYTSGKSVYSVELDADPTNNPRKLNGQIERVQAFKNRVLPILNRAVANELYWKTIIRKIETRVDIAENQSMVTETVKAEKSAELRKATAKNLAGDKVVASAFSGQGTLVDHICLAEERHADALSFLMEVKNIYENLNSTDMNLARQQRNILICAKLYGDASEPIENTGAAAEAPGSLQIAR
jgi:hypothetical protein